MLLAVPAGFRPPTLAALLALPAAVAFGGGGVAIAASALARRGRDALLGVYLLVLLCLLGPLLDWSLGIAVGGWIGALNPFFGLEDLVWDEDPGPALQTIGLWAGMGLLGTALAALRLRPACLQSSAERPAVSPCSYRPDGRTCSRLPSGTSFAESDGRGSNARSRLSDWA